MSITRRGVLYGSLGAAAAGLTTRRVAAAPEPIRFGWLTALTGANSAPGVGFNRGIVYAANKINAAGGVNGRMIEVITRDSSGDPAKAVNAATDLASNQKVHAVFGPVNSGESLATTPIFTRFKIPSLGICVVNSLIDPDEVPQRLPAFAGCLAMGRRRSPLPPRRPEGEEGRGARRQHRLRHHGDRRFGRQLPQGRRRGRLQRSDRCQRTGRLAQHAARARCRRAGDRLLEQFDRPRCPHDERARADRLGRRHGGPSRPGFGRRRASAGEAGILGQGLHCRLPLVQLTTPTATCRRAWRRSSTR